MKIAILTMVYNEPDYIERWCRHHGGQIGPDNCYVIDLGSDDETTDDLGRINVLRYPKRSMDDVAKSKLISHLCANLLGKYDAVIYVDIDELLVVDPEYFKNIQECLGAMKGDALNVIGLDILHIPKKEKDIYADIINANFPVTFQRRWICFNSALCKPSVMRKPFEWSAGFHFSPHPVQFGHLYLFRLRYFDIVSGLLRQARTRQSPWALANADQNRVLSDKEWIGALESIIDRPREPNYEMDMNSASLKNLLDMVLRSSLKQEDEAYKFDLDLYGPTLWPIPPRFRGLF